MTTEYNGHRVYRYRTGYDRRPLSACWGLRYWNIEPYDGPGWFGEIDESLINEDLLILPGMTDGGDHSGPCLVQFANREAFLNEFGGQDGVWSVSGDFGSFGVAVRLRDYVADDRLQSAIDFLSASTQSDALRVYDPKTYTAVLGDAIEKAWYDWALSFFESEIHKRIGDVDISGEDIRRIFDDATEAANLKWKNTEGIEVWINVKEVVRHVNVAALTEAIHK